MVYEVCFHGYTRLFTWIYTNKQMDYNSLFTWIYTNKQMVYKVCLHGYTRRINKWFMKFVYMDIHE